MNKHELIDAVAKVLGSKKLATEAVNATLQTISDSLIKGDRVTLAGFGTFTVAKRSARTGRNPQNGKVITVTAKTVPKFTAGTALRNAIYYAHGGIINGFPEAMGKCPICGLNCRKAMCSHHVFTGDGTFPYATYTSGAPFEVYSKAFDATLLGKLNSALDPIVTEGTEAIKKLQRTIDLSPALSKLVEDIAAGIKQTEDGVERDQYVDLIAFKEYLENFLEGCQGYIGSTYWVQDTPFASSKYLDYWANSAKTCGEELERRIEADLLSLGIDALAKPAA